MKLFGAAEARRRGKEGVWLGINTARCLEAHNATLPNDESAQRVCEEPSLHPYSAYPLQECYYVPESNVQKALAAMDTGHHRALTFRGNGDTDKEQDNGAALNPHTVALYGLTHEYIPPL
jgi:hypothetical protein